MVQKDDNQKEKTSASETQIELELKQANGKKGDYVEGINGSLSIIEAGGTKGADFECAILLTGYGRFHYFLLAVCGFVSTSEEMDVISMSFILPSAQCDLHLDTYKKGWLSSIIFIGMMAGAYIWGSIADAVGRRKVLMFISFMNGVCIVVSSFSQSYWFFMVFRFLNGVALGGSGPVIWSYFAEFQPKKKRGSMLSSMAAFWTLGNLFVACLAWLIIPSATAIRFPGFIFNSWRFFLMICSVPSFIVAVLLFFLPESPKFLLSRGKQDKALKVFRQIYSTNTGKSIESYPVHYLLQSDAASITQSSGNLSLLEKMMNNIVGNTKSLFKPPILRFTMISVSINFTFHVGYYGLMMWFPELFNRFDEYSRLNKVDTDASACQVTEFIVKLNAQLSSNNSEQHYLSGLPGPPAILCSNEIASSVYFDSLITVASAVPSNIIAILGMDKLGRKFFLVFSTLTAGICALCLSFVYSKTQNLIVSAVFSGVISCGNAALDCLITEIFPTNLRATGVAVSMVAARLGGIVGNIVIATLLDMYCPLPTFIVASLLIGGGLLCLILPNTTKEPLS